MFECHCFFNLSHNILHPFETLFISFTDYAVRMIESVSRRAFGSSRGTYNVRASELAHDNRKRLKTISCSVVFLDDTQHTFQVEVSRLLSFSQDLAREQFQITCFLMRNFPCDFFEKISSESCYSNLIKFCSIEICVPLPMQVNRSNAPA